MNFFSTKSKSLENGNPNVSGLPVHHNKSIMSSV